MIFPNFHMDIAFPTKEAYNNSVCTGTKKHKSARRARRIKMLYIGVDLGTSAVKLLLMDGEGKILNIVSKESLFMFPQISLGVFQ